MKEEEEEEEEEERRITPVCDRASLGSEPRQPTNQSVSLP
jgi:hypothetical protein